MSQIVRGSPTGRRKNEEVREQGGPQREEDNGRKGSGQGEEESEWEMRAKRRR